MLILDGFDDVCSLITFKDSDYEALKKFARGYLKDFIDPAEPPKNYYNIFEKKPESFKIILGHRRLIEKFIEHCENKAGNKVYISSKPHVSQKVSNSTSDGKILSESNDMDLNSAEKKLLECLASHTTKLVTDLTENALKKLKNIVVHVNKVVPGTRTCDLEAKIPCVYCSNMTMGYFSKGRWTISNYVRHLRDLYLKKDSPSGSLDCFVIHQTPSASMENMNSSSTPACTSSSDKKRKASFDPLDSSLEPSSKKEHFEIRRRHCG